MADLAGATLEAVDGDDGEHDTERGPDHQGAFGRRGQPGADRERGRQRQQVELVGADPNKLLELLFPLLLVIGAAVYAAWLLWRRPPGRGWALAPLVAVGVAYLLARADEFHLLPLSACLLYTSDAADEL